MNIFRRNRIQETAEEGTEIDLIVEAETIQGKTTETTTGMVVEITTTETEVEIAETTAEIETEVEEETDLIQEREEETNLDLDQIKDTLTEMTFAVSATELVI